MWDELIQIVNNIKGILSWIAPAVVFIFSLITASAIVRWGAQINLSIHTIFKKPILVIFWLLILFLFSITYFKYIHPFFE